MKLCVDWLTKQTIVKGICYLAGENGGSNPISGINIMDNPDTVPWLKKDEMILSTGYLFVSTDMTDHIIRDLHDKGCSALGIKMNRYIDRLPDEMIAQANELSFPIISIPFDSTMEEIVNIVYHQMFEDEMSATQRIATAYNHILMAVMRSNRLDEMTSGISVVVGSPVFLTNENFEILEYFIPEDSEITFPFTFCRDPNTVFSEKDILELTELEQQAVLPVRKLGKTIAEKTVTFLIFPVTNKNIVVGHLVCIEEKREFTSQDYDFISNIDSIIYIALVKNNFRSEEQRSNDERFYHMLLSGKTENISELESLCLINRFNYSAEMVCAVFTASGYERLTVAKRRTLERLFWNTCCSVLDSMEISYNKTLYDSTFLLFIYCDEKSNQNITADKMHKLMDSIIEALDNNKLHCCAGFSRSGSGIGNIPELYSQAVRALKFGSRLHPENRCFSYQEDYIIHNLYMSFSMSKLKEIYNEYILPLLQYDEKYSGELFHTIDEYIECRENMTAAAKKLFIHRNTMMYRLKQIEEILGVDIDSREALFCIQTGLYIKKIIDTE